MFRKSLLLCAILAIAAATFAACTTADSHDAAHEAGLQIAALTVIDGVGFHGIDTTLNGSSAKIDAAWLGKVRHAQTAANSVPWSKELQPKVKAFSEAAAKLGDALEKDDTKGAAEPAKVAHTAQHELSDGAWDALGKAAKVGGSGTHKD